jgi:hypothetical protein
MALEFMMKKVDEFIELMVFDGKERRTTEDKQLKWELLELLERKLKSLLKALFSFEKVKW